MVLHVTGRERERERGDESIAFAPFSGYISSRSPCYPHTLRAAAVGEQHSSGSVPQSLRPFPDPEGEWKPQVRFSTPPGVEPHRRLSLSLPLMGRDSAARRERKSRSDIEIVFASDGGSGEENTRV